ncbi:MAG: DNA primase [Oscillospiraceae bacterium]|nr:DNA primase [Oscillospiraceae bacterium]
MALPESFIQELKMRNDITEVISSYVNLKRRGRNMVGLCPFHGEKTPSFNVYTENGSFYCFGCGTGGDVITFIMKIENLDYIEAVKFLAQRAGMNMPENSYDNSMADLKSRIYEANRQAARYYFKMLHTSEGIDAMNYLRGRALSEKTIRHFGLGFAPAQRYSLCRHLKSLGFKDSEIVAANLAFKSKNGYGIYDRFSNRVMFPIIDLRGNVIAFGGRIMTDEKPKYLNTSDTPVFKKSANLFSLNNAKNTGSRTLILCEGYMDVIAVNQAGFENAVATLGTALTTEQAMLMKRYADEVVICYDADEAGQKATARAIEILRNAGLLIRVLTVPNGKDPDEFIRNKGDDGPAAFANILEKSANDVEYRISKLKNSYNINTSDGKIAFLTEAVKVLSSLDNPIEQEVYVSRLAKEAGVSKEAVDLQLKKLKGRKYRENTKKEFRQLQSNLSGRDDKVNPQHYQKPRSTAAEEALIAYLVHNPDKSDKISSLLNENGIQTDFNKKLYDYFQSRIKNSLDPMLNISADFTADEVAKIIQITSSYSKSVSTEQAMMEYINTINYESEKISKDKIGQASERELMEYLKKLKEKHK